jgi:branched-chain amino acid transport system substrate-binding protein
VFAFFAGGGAAKFVKDYAAAGLKQDPALRFGLPDRRHAGGPGRRCRGPADHAALCRWPDTPKDNAFRLAYAKTYKLQPDVYAVQGYDAAQMLAPA